jgi:hypothetical protein
MFRFLAVTAHRRLDVPFYDVFLFYFVRIVWHGQSLAGFPLLLHSLNSWRLFRRCDAFKHRSFMFE